VFKPLGRGKSHHRKGSEPGVPVASGVAGWDALAVRFANGSSIVKEEAKGFEGDSVVPGEGAACKAYWVDMGVLTVDLPSRGGFAEKR